MVSLHSRVPHAHPSAAILGDERLGAGVAVGPQQVLTAHYLVLGAKQIEVKALDGKPRPVARTTVDHETGLGLLVLEGPPLFAARPRGPAPIRPGLPVFLLTLTTDGERKGATGHVSSVGPFEAFWEYMLDAAIMTTAINPGLAGAPLFDKDGALIGLVTLSLAAVGRYSLAIPMDLFWSKQEALLEGTVRSRRAWAGIYPQGYDGGVVLTGVVPGGPADKAGLTRGDLILSLEGEPVSNLRELYQVLWRKTTGETLSLQVLRDGAIRVVEVVAGDRDAFYR
jgi:S1-C subfamily serine protease